MLDIKCYFNIFKQIELVINILDIIQIPQNIYQLNKLNT